MTPETTIAIVKQWRMQFIKNMVLIAMLYAGKLEPHWLYMWRIKRGHVKAIKALIRFRDELKEAK